MKRSLLIRIAAVLMFLHTAGHTFGVFGGKPATPTVARILQDMDQHHFSFMGRSASLGMFFEGYGVVLILVLLFSSIVLWWLAPQTESELGAKLLLLSFLYLTALALLEILYRFPAFLTIPAAACLLMALLVRRPVTAVAPNKGW
ncbi:MAG TPA: hypothetical protein VHE34_05300 [Puia sp.]|uniref:LIC_13387 family protein n=1 Tax=Puia sp. TaxID=2045100 RepID=UPI002B75CC86|nr:hypothetical protein [Puia sp.]HVU94617.1 hypothetical protein [Puia sp.]